MSGVERSLQQDRIRLLAADLALKPTHHVVIFTQFLYSVKRRVATGRMLLWRCLEDVVVDDAVMEAVDDTSLPSLLLISSSSNS